MLKAWLHVLARPGYQVNRDLLRISYWVATADLHHPCLSSSSGEKMTKDYVRI